MATTLESLVSDYRNRDGWTAIPFEEMPVHLQFALEANNLLDRALKKANLALGSHLTAKLEEIEVPITGHKNTPEVTFSIMSKQRILGLFEVERKVARVRVYTGEEGQVLTVINPQHLIAFSETFSKDHNLDSPVHVETVALRVEFAARKGQLKFG